jgi:hypothetical protein
VKDYIVEQESYKRCGRLPTSYLRLFLGVSAALREAVNSEPRKWSQYRER